MLKREKFPNFSILTAFKFFLVPTLMLLVAFETIAVTGCENSAMKDPTRATDNFNSNLPSSVAEAVLQDLSEQAQIPLNQLTITKAKKELWSNGCLDLAEAGEFCSQAMVPGWRVFVSGNDQTWVYHTDQQGRTLRVEP